VYFDRIPTGKEEKSKSKILSFRFCTSAFDTSISEHRVAGGNVYSESTGQESRVILLTARDFTLVENGFPRVYFGMIAVVTSFVVVKEG